MTKILNFVLKTRGVVGRVAHAKSSDPANPPQKKLERALGRYLPLYTLKLFPSKLSKFLYHLVLLRKIIIP